MAWYNVDCVQFEYHDNSSFMPRDDNGNIIAAMSIIQDKIGIMVIFNHLGHDRCGNSVMGHEYLRFHLKRWDQDFCNLKK